MTWSAGYTVLYLNYSEEFPPFLFFYKTDDAWMKESGPLDSLTHLLQSSHKFEITVLSLHLQAFQMFMGEEVKTMQALTQSSQTTTGPSSWDHHRCLTPSTEPELNPRTNWDISWVIGSRRVWRPGLERPAGCNKKCKNETTTDIQSKITH